MGKKRICIDVPEYLDRKVAEFLMNVESYLAIKGEFPYSKICINAGSKLCKKCEQPDCDLARGWMKNKVWDEKKRRHLIASRPDLPPPKYRWRKRNPKSLR